MTWHTCICSIKCVIQWCVLCCPRFACGTVNIGAFLATMPSSEPTSEHKPHQMTWWGCRKVEVPKNCHGDIKRYLYFNTAITVHDEERWCDTSPSHINDHLARDYINTGVLLSKCTEEETQDPWSYRLSVASKFYKIITLSFIIFDFDRLLLFSHLRYYFSSFCIRKTAEISFHQCIKY